MQFNQILVFILISIIKLICSAPTDSVISNSDVLESHSTSIIPSTSKDNKKVDYYGYRHVVADGVQRALDECRQKFKWDRWNCPKKAFLDILDRNPLPSNKEFALTRALIASGIVLSLIRSCSYGTNGLCGCSQPHLASNELMTNMSKFSWNGCDEIVKLGFKITKIYLDSQDLSQDEASRLINAHNYEVGRLAVKRNMKRKCKCHGVSGACQVNTCWTVVPDMSEVGDHLKRQYKIAAKVGALSAEETNIENLEKEIGSIDSEKLVFVDASPDYCYENPKLGINGTLGRYCSRAKHRSDGFEVSRSEKDSCERLCTKCGYKIERERMNVERQCDCRFVYCCSIECQRCPHVEDTFRCVRHS